MILEVKIEWVKVRPRYYTVTGGRLVQHRELHDGEAKFKEILKKYSVPYEEENGVYVIYEYK